MDERSRLLAAYDEQLRGRPDAPSALAIDSGVVKVSTTTPYRLALPT